MFSLFEETDKKSDKRNVSADTTTPLLTGDSSSPNKEDSVTQVERETHLVSDVDNGSEDGGSGDGGGE